MYKPTTNRLAAALADLARDVTSLASDLERGPSPGEDIAGYERRMAGRLRKIASRMLALSEGDARQH